MQLLRVQPTRLKLPAKGISFHDLFAFSCSIIVRLVREIHREKINWEKLFQRTVASDKVTAEQGIVMLSVLLYGPPQYSNFSREINKNFLSFSFNVTLRVGRSDFILFFFSSVLITHSHSLDAWNFFPSLFHMRILRVTQSSFIDLAIIWDEKLAHLRATNTSLLLIVFFYNHGKFHLKREKITHELENTRTTRTDSQQPNESRCEYRFTVAFECFFRFLYTESDISVVLTVKTARELRECQRVGVEVLLRKCL